MMSLVRRAGLALAVTVVGLVALAAPIAAIEARLTSLPLGRGTAVITWTGASGVTPTVNAIGGTVGRYPVSAHERLARYGQTGSHATVPALDKPLPLGDVTGTIGGATFTLHISLTVPSSLTQGTDQTVTLGAVTGTFRGQPVKATLSARTTGQTLDFKGSIGPASVSGVIAPVQHHGNRTTARATYDVTR